MTTIDLRQIRNDLNEYMIVCEKYEHCLTKYGEKLNHNGCKDVCWHGSILKDIDPANSSIMIYNCQNHKKCPLCFMARKETLKEVQPIVEEGPWKDANFKL